MEVTYYDDDCEETLTIIAEEVRQIESCGFTYFEIIVSDDKSIVIELSDLYAIRKEADNDIQRTRD